MTLPIRRCVWSLLAGVCALHIALHAPGPGRALADGGATALTQVSVPAAGIAGASASAANDPLADLVDEAIRVSSRRRLVANLHTPWQIVHGVLAYRRDFQIRDGDRDVPAIEWMTGNVRYKGEPWFEKTVHGGRAHPFTKPYIFEGHPNQFLALMSMSNLPRDFVLQTDGGPITIDDMLRHAQMTVSTREEITWTLWAFSHYLDYDARWHNERGEPWSMERLIQTEVNNDVNRAACGGTHGLFALASARDQYLQATKQPLRGVWLAADQKVQQHVQMVRMLQNPDGTFSTNFFAGRGVGQNFEQVLVSNGHTLEFLMRALPDERVNEEWVRRGVASLARGLIEYRNAPLDCGPLYHAVSGLTLFRERTRPTAPPLLGDAIEQGARPMPATGADKPVPSPIDREPDRTAAEPPQIVIQPAQPERRATPTREANPVRTDAESIARQPATGEAEPEQRGILPRIPLPFTPPAARSKPPSDDVPQPVPVPISPRRTTAAPETAPAIPVPAPRPVLPGAPTTVPPLLPEVDVAEAEQQRAQQEAASRAEDLRKREEQVRLEEERRKVEEEARLAEVRRQREEQARLEEARRQQEEQARLEEARRLRLTADTKRAEAEALAAEAAVRLAEAALKRAQAAAKQAEAEAKQAEADARQAEAAAKQAEAEAKQAEAAALRTQAAARQAELDALRAEAEAARQAANPAEPERK